MIQTREFHAGTAVSREALDTFSNVAFDERFFISGQNWVNAVRNAVIYFPANYLEQFNTNIETIRPNIEVFQLIDYQIDIQMLDDWFQIEDDNVYIFIAQFPYLFDILGNARTKLDEYFPNEILALELVIDDEYSDDERLYITIKTSLDVDESLSLLRQFENDWWLENLPLVQGKLNIDVDFI